MPVETSEVLAELEALGYTVEDCQTALTDLVLGMRAQARLDPHGYFRKAQFNSLAELTDRLLQVAVESATLRETLAWACEAFADQPEIVKLVKHLYDR